MNWKSTLIQVLITVAVLAIVFRVKPVKDIIIGT